MWFVFVTSIFLTGNLGFLVKNIGELERNVDNDDREMARAMAHFLNEFLAINNGCSQLMETRSNASNNY